jgi:DNA processing protein
MNIHSYIPNPSLANENPVDVLRLIRSENVGPVTFFHLVKFCGSATRALEMAPNMAARGGRSKPITIASKTEVEKELAALKKYGAKVLLYGAPDYPPLLLQLPDAPPVLFAFGHTHLLQKPTIGIVGARNASSNGLGFARKMARELGDAGYVVVSGLARGIDTAAHQASLGSGTVAVIAGGIDMIYPPENEKLYYEIAESGVIVSEMPMSAIPLARSFPARNRIIAGIAKGMVVVEASLKSGSLISANFAADYHRDVFSVPGSPLDPRCQGTNKLIKEGAILTESAADVVAHYRHSITKGPLMEQPALPFAPAPLGSLSEAELEATHLILREKLSPSPSSVDELIAECDKPAPLVLAALLELELAGKIERHAGRVSLRMEEELA